MKKLDYVLIIVIVSIIAFFTFSYFNKLFVDTSDAKVLITYKGLRLDVVDYEEGLDIIYEIEIKENNPTELILTKNHNGTIITKKFTIKENEAIYNRIHVLYQNIHVEEANCPNKVCMRTKMDSKHTLPLVCTNGVIVEFLSNLDYIGEIIV